VASLRSIASRTLSRNSERIAPVVVAEGGSRHRPGHVSLIDHAGLAVASVSGARWRACTPRFHNWQSRVTVRSLQFFNRVLSPPP
jgi:hypothetical protein